MSEYKWKNAKTNPPKIRRYVIGATREDVFVYSMFRYKNGKFQDYEGNVDERIEFWTYAPMPPNKTFSHP